MLNTQWVGDIKVKYDRIHITQKKVDFYSGEDMVASIDAVWNKESGDSLTLTCLEGVLRFQSVTR